MTRLEKCEILKNKGYTYNSDTGKIYGVYGKEISNLRKDGYIELFNNLRAHHFAWYMTYGNVDFEMLDHINGNRTDNRICNLRIVNNQQNSFNTRAKGFYFVKKNNKWRSRIKLNGETIHLGYFDSEDEARQAYLINKLKYHHF